MKVIKLTLENTPRMPCYINPNYIIEMSESRQGTRLVLIHDVVYVEETPEEIMKLIGGLNND